MTQMMPINHRMAMCRRLIDMRNAVGDALGYDFCPSPIWDMLLDLYLARHEKRGVYLWSLYMAAHVSPSTAHRRVLEMEKQGLVMRELSDQDRRCIGIEMTEGGVDKVNSLLDRLIGICHASPL
ncbi:MarR family transcriptional regulator [Sphingobium estronivorans]|uniref:MarR family transcriptional regulator n=1 Tax=Sphingobium estronivorans TaxID=1577690 RepID=UPI00123A4B09|nr:MarR family transcriptional regulator [Sphingobium estronivorans]